MVLYWQYRTFSLGVFFCFWWCFVATTTLLFGLFGGAHGLSIRLDRYTWSGRYVVCSIVSCPVLLPSLTHAPTMSFGFKHSPEEAVRRKSRDFEHMVSVNSQTFLCKLDRHVDHPDRSSHRSSLIFTPDTGRPPSFSTQHIFIPRRLLQAIQYATLEFWPTLTAIAVDYRPSLKAIIFLPKIFFEWLGESFLSNPTTILSILMSAFTMLFPTIRYTPFEEETKENRQKG